MSNQEQLPAHIDELSANISLYFWANWNKTWDHSFTVKVDMDDPVYQVAYNWWREETADNLDEVQLAYDHATAEWKEMFSQSSPIERLVFISSLDIDGNWEVGDPVSYKRALYALTFGLYEEFNDPEDQTGALRLKIASGENLEGTSSVPLSVIEEAFNMDLD